MLKNRYLNLGTRYQHKHDSTDINLVLMTKRFMIHVIRNQSNTGQSPVFENFSSVTFFNF